MPQATRRGSVYHSRASERQRILRAFGLIGNVVLYTTALFCVTALIYPPIVGWLW